MRLDKYLSTYAGMSRKEARQAVRNGVVSVDGTIEKVESRKVEREQRITVNGNPIQAEEFVYYMMNKPAGFLTATKDAHDKTVLDLMPSVQRNIFPMGRLDKDTEGLLILTDDGVLAHRLLSPAYHVEKVYEVNYEGELPETAVEDFSQGIDIGEKHRTKPARLEIIASGKARLAISEGKFHQVKRMFAVAGTCVTGLKRIAFAGLVLDDKLASGAYRRLTEEEVKQLRMGGKHGKEKFLCGQEGKDTGDIPDMG